MADTAIFIQIDEGKSIQGSATAEIREGWIFVDSLTFGVRREADRQQGGKAQTHADKKSGARPMADDVSVSKALCLASCDLFKAVFADEPIEQIVIDVCAPSKLDQKQTGSMRWYFSYVLETCVVKSYSVTVEGDSNKGPSETIEFDFLKLTTWFREWDGNNNPTEKEFDQTYDFVKAYDDTAAGGEDLDALFGRTENP